jgi:trans-aconitate 2-methyltransferase
MAGGLIESLNPQPGERILDVGCGTGQLTADIARAGAIVTGLDSSSDMLAEARRNYPGLSFVVGDAADFILPGSFDAIFSNAALHWVKNAEGAVQSFARALRPGGRFIAEFGGHGNITSVQAALRAVLGPDADARSPWYYPSIGEYAPILERHGFELRDASLFDRPTPLQGEDGMESWLRMFMPTYLRELNPDRADEVVRNLVDLLRPTLYRNGVWTVDYRRIRVSTIRTV